MTIDPYFKVTVLNASYSPQQLVYQALHQCYSEEFVTTEPVPSETECGEIIVKRLLAGGRGHYGCLENPQISFNIGWFPHSTMQQFRTHRIGITFDVQSGRYTGQRILDVFEGERKVEEVFYLRPVGKYTDRQGHSYEYTERERDRDLEWCLEACARYREKIAKGYSEEHARGIIPFDIRQHWVMSCNMRSLMHLLDLRAAANAQLECQQLCDLLFPWFLSWAPEVAKWYEKNRMGKARLAP